MRHVSFCDRLSPRVRYFETLETAVGQLIFQFTKCSHIQPPLHLLRPSFWRRILSPCSREGSRRTRQRPWKRASSARSPQQPTCSLCLLLPVRTTARTLAHPRTSRRRPTALNTNTNSTTTNSPGTLRVLCNSCQTMQRPSQQPRRCCGSCWRDRLRYTSWDERWSSCRCVCVFFVCVFVACCLCSVHRCTSCVALLLSTCTFALNSPLALGCVLSVSAGALGAAAGPSGV